MIKNTANLIIDASPVGIFYTDKTGNYAYVNKKWCDITGLAPDSTTNADWLSAVHPDDRDCCEQLWADAFKSCSHYQSSHRYQRVDGKIIYAFAQAFPEIHHGVLKGYIGTLTEISPLPSSQKKPYKSLKHLEKPLSHDEKLVRTIAKMEARWVSLVENIPDFLITVDSKGTILFINRTVSNIDRNTVRGTSLYDYLEEEDRHITQQALRRLFKSGEPVRYVVKSQGERGKTAWYSNRVGPIFQNGQVIAATIIATDITKRLQLHKKASEQQRELSHRHQINSLDELSSSFSHELNQPLSAITNYAEGCIRRLKTNTMDTQNLLSILNKISAQADRAGSIMKRMRNLVKKGSPTQSITQINKIICDAVNFMPADNIGTSIKIIYSLGADLPDVSVDKIQITQVITNILRNGVESILSTEDKAGSITIKTKKHNTNNILVSISDEGEGIKADDINQIFEPFFSTKKSGMGIGLSICRSIIESNGGRLSATNNKRQGATFEFTLPIHLSKGNLS